MIQITRRLFLSIFVVVLIAWGVLENARAQDAKKVKAGGSGFYGADQARRGKAVFANSCESCHTTASASLPTNAGDPIPLIGSEFLAKWRTVGDLFSKVRTTMPADKMGQLSDETLLDVVAYILQVNGLPATRQDLPVDPNTLHAIILDDTLARKQIVATDVSTGAFYTEDQARRGQAYFLGNCATCHSTTPTPSQLDLAMGRKGALLSDYRYMSVATGSARWQRYPNVFSLFNKIRTMPAQEPGGLSLGTYLDLTAYLLKINGAPSGKEELSYSVNGMKSMMLNEPGFEKMFNGKNFDGIKFVIGVNCKQKEAGCLQNEPGRPFKVEEGAIICSGSPQGYWYFDRKYLNFTLRFDYRYMRPKDLQDENDFLGASGYFLFVTEHQVWPRMLQMEGGFRGTLAPAPLGASAKFTRDAEASRRVARPLNEWNSVEIVSKNGQVMGYLNGALVATVTEHDFKEPGYIGFQSEAGEIHWRNIRIKPE